MRTENRLVTLVGTLAVLLFGIAPALADSNAIDFESYSVGTINGQDGWSSTGAAGSGCAMYDHLVDSSLGTLGFGSQSLRISNAVTSGCFGDQTFSKSLTDEAGETTAQNGGMSGGVRQPHFEAMWDFASTVPTAEQPGLSVVASPDRGDGARMSWIQMADTPAGLDVNFFNYKDVAPMGTLASPADGCGVGDDFMFSPVATGLDRTMPHNIKVTMDLLDGPANDVVKVYVDGVLMHTDTSWEDYFRWCTESGGGVVGDPVADASRTVDSILFRTGGAAAPATISKGFLIDNLSISSGPIPPVLVGPPTDKDQCKKGGWETFNNPTFKNQGDCVSFVASQGKAKGNPVINFFRSLFN